MSETGIARRTPRVYSNLLQQARPLMDVTSIPSAESLAGLFAEAKGALHSDGALAISRFEAILSSVHKLLLHFQFVGREERPEATKIRPRSPDFEIDSLRFSGGEKDALVLDDDEEMAGVVARSLRGAGYRVDARTDPLEAVMLLTRVRYRCLIADLMMPRMDGREVLHIGKTLQPHLVSVLFTGFPKTAEDAKVESLADLFFHKPFDLEGFVRTIELALEKQDERL